MLAQQQRILEKLDSFGWELIEQEQTNLEWWADEIWRLKSIWSPQECCVFLTFLVDPMWDKPRRKSEGVWALKASLQRPTDRSPTTGEIDFSLGRGWERHLNEFFAGLAQLRLAYQASGQQPESIVEGETTLTGRFQFIEPPARADGS